MNKNWSCNTIWKVQSDWKLGDILYLESVITPSHVIGNCVAHHNDLYTFWKILVLHKFREIMEVYMSVRSTFVLFCSKECWTERFDYFFLIRLCINAGGVSIQHFVKLRLTKLLLMVTRGSVWFVNKYFRHQTLYRCISDELSTEKS